MHRRRMLSEQYFKGGMHYFTLDRSMVAATGRLQILLVGMPLACCLLAVTGSRVSPAFQRRMCSRAQLGILYLGYEYYATTPGPPPHPFAPSRHQIGYSRRHRCTCAMTQEWV